MDPRARRWLLVGGIAGLFLISWIFLFGLVVTTVAFALMGLTTYLITRFFRRSSTKEAL